MTQFTRRAALLTAAAAALASPAHAALTGELANHPGYRAWTRVARPTPAPLTAPVETDTGTKLLRDWLDGRPAVLALWATWCGPCLVEKPHQAAMARRLAQVNASARILPLQAYDRATVQSARRTLDRLEARNLPMVRASEAAEAGFIRVFGASPRDRTRVSMPSLLLLNAEGVEIGRAVGTMTGVDGETDYWQTEETFDFLSRLR
jgi:thiol-disulfide isomerase/thioredoxin